MCELGGRGSSIETTPTVAVGSTMAVGWILTLPIMVGPSGLLVASLSGQLSLNLQRYRRLA